VSLRNDTPSGEAEQAADYNTAAARRPSINVSAIGRNTPNAVEISRTNGRYCEIEAEGWVVSINKQQR
jgi:hypothetical protein